MPCILRRPRYAFNLGTFEWATAVVKHKLVGLDAITIVDNYVAIYIKVCALVQNMSAEAGTNFVSVQRVPTTTEALKQAVTNQPVIVGVDAGDWSDYYDVRHCFEH